MFENKFSKRRLKIFFSLKSLERGFWGAVWFKWDRVRSMPLV